MSCLAFTRRLRGKRTIRSSGPQPAVGGNFALASVVMSMPMTAKSPLSSSQMSGQPWHAAVLAPLACGSRPILRRNSMDAFMLNQQSARSGKNARTKYSVYTVVHIGGFGFACDRENSKPPENRGREHPHVSPQSGLEPGKIGRKSRFASQLHRRR